MRISPLAVLLVLSLLATSMAQATEEKKPGWIRRTLSLVGIGKERSKEKTSTTRTKNLSMTMVVTPEPVKLSENRQLKIALSLTNRSKRGVQLQFPTTQRIEVLIRDGAGKLVTQWSEDQSFENQQFFVMINPGERIEYNCSIGTRDLSAGKPYVVEGFFPNFETLKATKQITPLP